jgi:ribose transport system permease protein
MSAKWFGYWKSCDHSLPAEFPSFMFPIAAFAFLTPTFLSPNNLLNVCTSASVVAIVGLGMTLAIASGNFDLSVGSTAAFAGCITMSLVPQIGVMPAIALGVLSGGLIGWVNGLIVTELRVPAFIGKMQAMDLRSTFSVGVQSAEQPVGLEG